MKYLVGAIIVIVVLVGGWLLFFSGEDMPADEQNLGTASSDQDLPKNDQGDEMQMSDEMVAGEVVVLETNRGNIEITLDNANAPQTTGNFKKLVSEGFYDGTKFHRVIANFMIQGGDPFSRDDSMVARWGTGGPGYMFADEIHDENHNVVGSISMANAGPNTNGSQFFINVADNTFLDTKHTVFGMVSVGLDVVNAISGASTDAADRPVEPVVINKAYIK